MSSAALLLAIAPVLLDAGGVWKGTAAGDGESYPASGLPASLWLEDGADGAVRGSVRVQGLGEREVTGSFEAGSGALALEGRFDGNDFRVEAILDGEQLAGELTGLGTSLSLTARRIAERVLAPPESPAAPVDLDALETEDWHADLDFLAAYLPQVHADAFHTRSEADWREAVLVLEEDLHGLDGDGAAVALAQLVAGVGDAHTELDWREPQGFVDFPVAFTALADGVFVTRVDARWEQALGARVLRVGELPVEEALARAASVFAVENESWRLERGSQLLSVARLLWALGVVPSRDRLPLVLEDPDGQRVEVELTARGSGNLRSAPDPRRGDLPLSMRHRAEPYWFETLPDHGAVFLAYDRCAEVPDSPLGELLTELLSVVDELHADRLVIDLRRNQGGDSSVLSRHLARLAAHPRLGRPGGVVALIGPRTYSSGMMNALQLRTALGARLVGQPTGGRPNSYGELRSFRLPRSGLRVFYSTKYFPQLEGEDPPSLEPDEHVAPSSEDLFGGRDPVLEAALAR